MTVLRAIAAAMGTLASHHARAEPLPADLTGSLVANPAMVQAGQSPKLIWSISYPSVVKQYVKITPSVPTDPGGGGDGGQPGTIIPLQNLYADVRIIGQGVTVTSNNSGYTFVPTQATMSINSTTDFREIFYGTNPQINPGAVINIKNVFGTTYTNNLIQSGKAIRFGGRYKYNNAWGTYYKSNDGTDNVRFLVSGDRPPSNVPQYNAPSLESFLRPYLDATGKVKIGPMDVIVFMELTHSSSQKSDPGYDLQDLVLLVTFRKN
ncbi:hypothetical protein GCM10023212_32340 [Luteolibacter yonseiensis]